MKNTTWVVGLAGGTGSGKTAIARGLVDHLGGLIIDVDSYYIDRSGLSPDERHRANYDEPDAIDVVLLVEHLRRLVRGEAVQKPLYSFETHSRVGAETVMPAELLVVEGLFALYWVSLRALCGVKVFVEVPSDLRLIRRMRRDVTERARTVEQVLHQYLGTVRPMHERYVEPTRTHADLVLRNDGRLQDAVERVVSAVQRTRVA